jgi:hypothetical protein
VISEAYGTPLEWFMRDDASASPRLLIEGQLPPDPDYGRGREGRRIRIPARRVAARAKFSRAGTQTRQTATKK